MGHPLSYDVRCDLITGMEEWRKSLPPAPVPPDLLGLNLRAPDPRDYDMRLIPGVAENLAVGFPDSYDLVRQINGPALNQGSVPSCVAHTCAGMMQIFQQEEESIWRLFDAPRAHRETGDPSQGRWPDDLLKYCREQGMPLANTESRYKIISYAFAPKTSPEEWANTIKAAVAADHPCPVCLLLPSLFGWESGGTITQGYHEVLIVGYRRDAFLIRNSWGDDWGKNGLGWVPIGYLNQSNWQNGYVIAHTVTDEILLPQPQPQPEPQPEPEPEPQPEPQPEPEPQPVMLGVAGRLSGGGLEFVKAGTVLIASGGGFSGNLQVDRVDGQPEPEPEPQPEPQPEPGDLTVDAQIWPAYGRGHLISVKVQGPASSVTVTVAQAAENKPLTGPTTLRPSDAWQGPIFVRGLTAGQSATVRAEGDGHRGEKQLMVP